MREIAQTCKISKALIYHYFRTKEEILFQVMASQTIGMVEIVKKVAILKAKPSEKVRSLIRQFIWLRVRGAREYALPISEIRHLSPQQRERILALQYELAGQVMDMLSSGTPKRSRAQPDISQAAIFLGLLESAGAWLQHIGEVDVEALTHFITYGVSPALREAPLENQH
jgi:AcrR family transcriptional regulator